MTGCFLGRRFNDPKTLREKVAFQYFQDMPRTAGKVASVLHSRPLAFSYVAIRPALQAPIAHHAVLAA
jgi:hypothetical protein